MIASLLGLSMQSGAPIDVYRLPIGDSAPIMAKPGIVDRNGRAATVENIVNAARPFHFVYLGESHDHAEHHKMQAAIIEGLAKAGRNVIVGFEMFTRPVQDNLNGWTLGWWSEDEFIEKSDWKKQWGFDFALYRPIFEAVRSNKLPMVALNVPRDYVRTVSRQGLDALSAEQKAALPLPFRTNPDHKKVFDALTGGHSMGPGVNMDNMYNAQVVWDEGMADSALKYLARKPMSPSTVMVVVAGSGHVMYGQGINWRVKQRTGMDGITVTMLEGNEPRQVSKSLGDFIYMAPEQPRK